MTIPELIVSIGIFMICVYGLAQWWHERKMDRWSKMLDKIWQDGWPS